MIRTAFGLRGIGPAQKVPRPAWNGVWRRMLSSRPGQTLFTEVGFARTNLFLNTSRHPIRRPAGIKFAPIQRRGFRFSPWRQNTTQQPGQEKLSLTGRLKKLSKEYGWSAVGVYLALSVLDFPFCFLLVRVVGTDTIGKIEHKVVSTVKSVIPDSVRHKWNEYRNSLKSAEVEALGNGDISEKVEMVGWGVEEAQQRNQEEASLATQLALAYAIHKSFIFFRVPLTAAVTPKVVKVLRSWGWNIGKRAGR